MATVVCKHDGHCTYLESVTGNGNKIVRVLAHGFLYLGHILDHIAYELLRQGLHEGDNLTPQDFPEWPDLDPEG